MEMTSQRTSMDIGALKKTKAQYFWDVNQMNKNINAPLSKILNYESQYFIPNLHTNGLSY